MRRIHSLFLLAALGSAPSSIAVAQAAAAPSPPSADARLKGLYEAYADWDQKESGFFIDSKGENQDAAYLPRVDPAAQLARARFQQNLLEQLNAVPAGSLSPGERINAGVLRAILEAAISDA